MLILSNDRIIIRRGENMKILLRILLSIICAIIVFFYAPIFESKAPTTDNNVSIDILPTEINFISYTLNNDAELYISGEVLHFDEEVETIQAVINHESTYLVTDFVFSDNDDKIAFSGKIELKDFIEEIESEDYISFISIYVNDESQLIKTDNLNEIFASLNLFDQHHIINIFDGSRYGYIGMRIVTKPGLPNVSDETYYDEEDIDYSLPIRYLPVDSASKNTISTFYFYGETLNLEGYINNQNMLNRTLLLVDSKGNNVMSFKNSSTIDSGLKVYELDEGTYFLESISGNTMYAHTEMFPRKEVFYTITRDNMNKRITINVDQENRFTISVKDIPHYELPDAYYDIYLKAGHGGTISYYNGNGTGTHYCEDYVNYDNGYICPNMLWEADYNILVNDYLKQRFEDHGLKVILSHVERIENVPAYGDNGKIDKVYRYQAKYLLNNHHNGGYNGANGFEIYASVDSSTEWANSILNSGITNINYADDSIIQRVLDPESSGYFSKLDFYYNIRETGGYATKAGMMYPYVKDVSKQDDIKNYALYNYGAEALLMEYSYMTNNDDFEYYMNNFVSYMEAVIKGTVEYLDIEYFENTN
jgi:N-acetylmuramoyl-L-alanine amidase